MNADNAIADDASKSKCAACGKEGNSLKSCAACKLVKYCNITCQKAHRPWHKKECRKRAAELFDEALFQEPPKEECPICFLPFTHEACERTYKTCCGKMLCNGCTHGIEKRAAAEQNPELDVCPYCREQKRDPDQEFVERLEKRIKCGDAIAFYSMACAHSTGSNGVSINPKKAFEMWIKAGELGYSAGYCNAGTAYLNGHGVGIDEKKAKHYYELAAMKGDTHARYNIGNMEANAGNYKRAIKYYSIAARAGFKKSLDILTYGYLAGEIAKEEYEKIFSAYQISIDEMKSDMRDEAIRMGR